MQSRLIAASFAALAHLSAAVKEGADAGQGASDPAATLIGYYENCLVAIQSLTLEADELQGKQRNFVNFDLAGIDDACPDLEVLVWLELPDFYTFDSDEQEEAETKWTLRGADVTNGPFSHQFNTTTVGNTQNPIYAHVTVTPYGWDCAMAMTDDCAEMSEYQPCQATVTDLSGGVTLNQDKPDNYWGPDGMSHLFNWSINDLYSCNLCATYTATSSDGSESTASGSMDFTELVNFAHSPATSTTLTSTSTYYGFEHCLTLSNCADSTDVYYSKCMPSTDPDDMGSEGPGGGGRNFYNPWPECDVTGSFSTTSVAQGQAGLMVANNWVTTLASRCAISGLQGTVSVGPTFTMDLDSVTSGTHTDSNDVTGLPDAVFDNFPITVSASLTVTATDGTGPWTFSAADYEYFPDCEFSADSAHLSFSLLQDGTNANNQHVDFKVTGASTVGAYCSGMSGAFELSHNGKPKQTINVNEEDFPQGAGATGSIAGDFNEIEFADGEWCVTWSTTPSGWKNGAPPTKTTEKQCKTVDAPACTMTLGQNVGGTVLEDTMQMQIDYGTTFAAGAWCDMDSTVFTYEYAMNGQPKAAVPGSWGEDLAASGAFSDSTTMDEQDFAVTASFSAVFSPVWDSQDEVSAAAEDKSWTHQETCRPAVANDFPVITNFTVSGDYQVNILFDAFFVSTGSQNCDDMVATYSLFSSTSQDALDSFTKDGLLCEAELDQEHCHYSFTADEEDACFTVRVEYGQSTNAARSVTMPSRQFCHVPTCKLSADDVTWNGGDCSSGSDIVHSFNAGVTANKWCKELAGQLTVTSGSGIEFASASLTEGGDVSVTQTAAFTDSEYTVAATWSTQTRDANVSAAFTYAMEPACCVASYETDFKFTKDTLNRVSAKQMVSGSANALCGAPSFTVSQGDDEAVLAAGVEKYYWSAMPSKTGDYMVELDVAYGNFPDAESMPAATTSTSATHGWTQGCQVNITSFEFTNFTAADYDAGTEGTATVVVGGQDIGDCGTTMTASAHLTEYIDGQEITQIPLALGAAFYSDEGQSIVSVVSRDQAMYTLTVSLSADDAASVEAHQALTTTEDGFVNVISDEKVSPKTANLPAKCNIADLSITWVSYAEQSEDPQPWSAMALATFEGTFYAENSCTDPFGTITIYDASNATFGSFEVDDFTQDGRTYTFEDAVVPFANLKGDYMAEIVMSDRGYAMEEEVGQSDTNAWWPPCYLNVTQLSKSAQVNSLDWLRTSVDFTVAVDQLGDQGCTSTWGKFMIHDSTGATTFETLIEDENMNAAVSDSYTFQVSLPADKIDNALFVVNDTRSADGATATLDSAYMTPATPDCHVNVVDFCLTDAEASSTSYGKWDFTFSLRVQSNSACGAVAATLDLVADDNFLANVAVDGDSIVSAFDCQCDQVVTVTADYDGSSASVYGQLAISNGQSTAVQITDSCTFEM